VVVPLPDPLPEPVPLPELLPESVEPPHPASHNAVIPMIALEANFLMFLT
jgi:hypothetical protein